VGELTHVIEEESDESKAVIKEKEDAVVVSQTSNDEQLNHIVEDAIDAAAETNAETIQEAVESALTSPASAVNKDVIVETQVETTVETTVEAKVEEEEAPEAPKSSWATVLGLQSIINVLSSPFRARRN